MVLYDLNGGIGAVEKGTLSIRAKKDFALKDGTEPKTTSSILSKEVLNCISEKVGVAINKITVNVSKETNGMAKGISDLVINEVTVNLFLILVLSVVSANILD